MVDTQQMSPGQVEKILTKSVKQAIAQSSITSTRSGNKELGFLIKEVIPAPFDSEADVEKVGAALGQKITELCQQNDKQNLDAGVIRQLRYRKDWSAEFDIPGALPTEKISKKNSKSIQTVITASVVETAQKETAELTAPEPESGEAETAAVSPQSAEAEALLSEESDETNTMSSDPAESGLSEEASAVPEAAEAEVIEKVNSGAPGAGANTSAPVNPGAAALSNAEPTASDDK